MSLRSVVWHFKSDHFDFAALCYQLPAIVKAGKTRGVTIVISPLISLIHDQVRALKKKNVVAAPYLGKDAMTDMERDVVMEDLRSSEPETSILYVTPEMVRPSTPPMLPR